MRIPKWEYVCWGSLGTILIFGVVAWLWTLSGGDDLLSAGEVAAGGIVCIVPDESDTLELIERADIVEDRDRYNPPFTIGTTSGRTVVISWDANGVHVTGDVNDFDEAAKLFFLCKIRGYMEEYYNGRMGGGDE